MAAPFEEWYSGVPPITRFYATGVVITTLACFIKVITPFDLYLNMHLVFFQHQYWRLVTNFFYHGALGIDFLFHLFFIVRYSRMLEESTFRNRTADYVFMILFGATLLTIIAQFSNSLFLSQPLTFMLVYVWSRNNPNMSISLLGMIHFRAAWLPWVLLGFTMIMNGVLPTNDLLGILVGHVYYYCSTIYPRKYRRTMLNTPAILKRIFDARDDDAFMEPIANPGGFGWGERPPMPEDTPIVAPQAAHEEEAELTAARFNDDHED